MDTLKTLVELLQNRILIIDGAMGTMTQRYKLGDAEYRGERFKNHPVALQNNSDVLSLTQPHVIEEVHAGYLDAGADIISTNTFTGTSISQADFGLQDYVREMAVAGARLARKAADTAMARDPSRPRFVAGSLGPCTRSASVVVDADRPAYRATTFDEVRVSYGEQARAL